MASRETVNSNPASDPQHRVHELALPPHKRRRWWLWVLVLIIAGLAVWHFRKSAAKQSQSASAAARRLANQALPVSVATAVKGNLPVYFTGLGTVTAYYTVTVHTRVDGQIMKVYFREGQFVHEGDALVEIDPRPYEVQLEQALGQLAKDNAALKDATVDFNRYTALYASGVIPKQQLDTQTSTMDQGKGAVAADQASIANAKLQLAYCHITAPISGRIGLRLVDPGNIVHAADTNGLIVITQLKPIAVIFTLPQDELEEVYKELRARDRLPADAYDRDDTTKIASGYLETIDNQIDTTTGTYKLKAVFSNADNALFPNQFVNVHLLVRTDQNVTLVPTAAVQRGPQGNYVYVVNQNMAHVRTVETGIAQGNVIAIQSGVQPGEEVVTDGLDKLTDGSKIEARTPVGGVVSGMAAPSQQPTGKRGTSLDNSSAPTKLPAKRRRSGSAQP